MKEKILSILLTDFITLGCIICFSYGICLYSNISTNNDKDNRIARVVIDDPIIDSKTATPKPSTSAATATPAPTATPTPTPCAAGTYGSPGSCTTCPKGSRCPGGTSKYECDAGYYQGSTGQSSCSQCGAGKYSSSGAESCSNCSAGTSCPAGSDSSSDCTTCATGYISSAGSACTACSKGYTNNSDHTKCVEICSAGYYPNSSGTCSECEAGYVCSDGNGREACPKGHKCPNKKMTSATECSAGTYQKNTGKTSCDKCPAGSACPAGSVDPTACTGNTYSKEGASECSKCGVDTANDDHSGCDKCSVKISGNDKLSPGDTGPIAVVQTNCTGSASLSTSNGTLYDATYTFAGGSKAYASRVKAPEEDTCYTLKVSGSVSNDGSSKSFGLSIAISDKWHEICTNCCLKDNLNGKGRANQIGEDSYGTVQKQVVSTSGSYYHYDSAWSRSCNPPTPLKTYTYCCVDNELPGLSDVVFPVEYATDKDCNFFARRNGYPEDSYTLLLSGDDGDFDMAKCVKPPVVPGRCNSYAIPTFVENYDSAPECESEVDIYIHDGEECTNTENSENKSFYRISCKKTVKTKFDYGDDNDRRTKYDLKKGNGLQFGIYIDTKVDCDYTFYDTVWKSAYNNFITKIKLIDDNLEVYVRNNDPNGWKNYIDRNFPNKLSKKNVNTLYELWNVVKELREVVEYYNAYKPTDNYKENATMTITTKYNGTEKINTSNFQQIILDEGSFSEFNVVTKQLDVPGITNPKNYIWTTSVNPRRIKLVPAKVCVNARDGAISLADENGECPNVSIDGGNRLYIDNAVDPGIYSIMVNVSGLGTNNSQIINNRCSIYVADEKIFYRPIDVTNPFINDNWKKTKIGENWFNKSYDFTKTIQSSTWNGRALKVIELSKEEIPQIQGQNAQYIRNNDSPYMGMCEMPNRSNDDLVCTKIQ